MLWTALLLSVVAILWNPANGFAQSALLETSRFSAFRYFCFGIHDDIWQLQEQKITTRAHLSSVLWYYCCASLRSESLCVTLAEWKPLSLNECCFHRSAKMNNSALQLSRSESHALRLIHTHFSYPDRPMSRFLPVCYNQSPRCVQNHAWLWAMFSFVPSISWVFIAALRAWSVRRAPSTWRRDTPSAFPSVCSIPCSHFSRNDDLEVLKSPCRLLLISRRVRSGS